MTSALSLANVMVARGARDIVLDATATFSSGRLVALLGPNGAGKSTLIRAIAGLIPARGEIDIGGIPLATLDRKHRARTIAYLPQGHHIHWPLSVRDVVALGRYPHGVNDPARMSAENERIVDEALTRMDIAALAGRTVTTLSGGERARAMLARVLATKAPVLLADEPTASLDPRHQIAVMQELKAESRRGTLVIAVTHDLTLASRLADEIVLMDKGSIVAHGTAAEVLTDESFAAVYGVKVLRKRVGEETLIAPWGLA